MPYNWVKRAGQGLVVLAVLCGNAVPAAEVADTSTRTPAGELQWVDIGGPQAANVSGDFATGQHVMLVKFAAGMTTPLHVHSHDYVGVVVSGVARHSIPGKPETEVDLPAGSHWSIPANLPHISECLPGAECVFALYQYDAFDFITVQ